MEVGVLNLSCEGRLEEGEAGDEVLAKRLNNDKLRSVPPLWYLRSQFSQAMPPFDQLASTSHSPQGKEDDRVLSGPGLVSTSPTLIFTSH